MGGQKQLLGDSVVPFVAMLCLLRRTRPALFVHECTRTFRWTLVGGDAEQEDSISGELGGKALFPGYNVYHTLTNPIDFGCPVRRTRSYSAIVRGDHYLQRGYLVLVEMNSKWNCLASLRENWKQPKADASIFFGSPAEEAGLLQWLSNFGVGRTWTMDKLGQRTRLRLLNFNFNDIF